MIKKFNKAFTLVELVVVVAIIAVLAGISIPIYFGITKNANETIIINRAKQIMTSDLIDANGDYSKIPPLNCTLEDAINYVNTDYQGFYDSSNNTWSTIIDDKICIYNLTTSNWTVERINEDIIASLNDRNYNISFLSAEYKLKINTLEFVNHSLMETCIHDHMLLINEYNHECFICNDCGLYGIDLITKIEKNPTTNAEGIMRYQYKTSESENEFTRIIPKTKFSDWFWAFYNDKNKDGMPEFDSFEYIDYTTVSYKYLYKTSDFIDYPSSDLSIYGGLSDDDWNNFYDEYENKFNLLDIELAKYIEGTEEYNNILNQYISLENEYTYLEELYIQMDDEAYLKYQQACKEYENLNNISLNNINPDKTQKITEKQKLYYFLHKPFNYNPTKSYPILVFYPGSGAVLYSFFGTSNIGSQTLQEGDFYFDKYRQTKSNGLNSKYTNYSSSAMDQEGNWLDGQLNIRDGSWCSSFFVNWYNEVKNPGTGRDLYDCFILFLQPSDSNWWSSSYYLSMTNQVNVPEIEGAIKITPEMTGDSSYKGYSRPTYDSSYVSPAPDGQLACKLIDKMSKTYNIDLKRQYVAGGSLGGAFTMDMINQYHDRFACGIPVVAASADITEKTAQAIVKDGMNVWAISGDGDTNCNKYFSKLFVQGLNKAKVDLNIIDNYVYQYSFFPGGHSCAYIGGTLRNATQGVSITYSKQVLDFMFNSSK